MWIELDLERTQLDAFTCLDRVKVGVARSFTLRVSFPWIPAAGPGGGIHRRRYVVQDVVDRPDMVLMTMRDNYAHHLVCSALAHTRSRE